MFTSTDTENAFHKSSKPFQIKTQNGKRLYKYNKIYLLKDNNNYTKEQSSEKNPQKHKLALNACYDY